jgi:hypothetical protein
MGKKKNGKRNISQEEIEEIAKKTGMNCIESECCLQKAHKKIGVRRRDRPEREPSKGILTTRKEYCFLPIGGVLDIFPPDEELIETNREDNI